MLRRLCINSPFKNHFRTIYSKVEGVPPDWLIFLQQDIDLRPRSVERWWRKKQWETLVNDQKLDPERIRILGPDLSAAHFLIMRNVAVKFKGADKWIEPIKKKNEPVVIPRSYVRGLHLEAIDASNSKLMFESLDNLEGLEHLRYLNLSGCSYVDDWTLNRLHMFNKSLEYLDVSKCENITERGLACLADKLPNLKYLKMKEMPKVNYAGFVQVLLQECKPTLRIEGVPSEDVPEDANLEPIFISGMILHTYERATFKLGERILISDERENDNSPLLLEAGIITEDQLKDNINNCTNLIEEGTDCNQLKTSSI
ncbi:DgyrCDS9744 [Dimorphilus gyrociliatus]|uniref:DgyrCDS9744 n=1 Tax=Dimorphilus gyrociliatus TaxID=2664684 RepID=A0A7I8W367_9ANNE|nr:DgyrCDS9744 [Dimorphilus gyrociliatus]